MSCMRQFFQDVSEIQGGALPVFEKEVDPEHCTQADLYWTQSLGVRLWVDSLKLEKGQVDWGKKEQQFLGFEAGC